MGRAAGLDTPDGADPPDRGPHPHRRRRDDSSRQPLNGDQAAGRIRAGRQRPANHRELGGGLIPLPGLGHRILRTGCERSPVERERHAEIEPAGIGVDSLRTAVGDLHHAGKAALAIDLSDALVGAADGFGVGRSGRIDPRRDLSRRRLPCGGTVRSLPGTGPIGERSRSERRRDRGQRRSQARSGAGRDRPMLDRRQRHLHNEPRATAKVSYRGASFAAKAPPAAFSASPAQRPRPRARQGPTSRRHPTDAPAPRRRDHR